MKNTIRGVLAGTAIAAGLALGLAGPANATSAIIGDEGDMSASNYAAELQYAGINELISQAATLGPSVCSYRAQGYTAQQLISADDGPTTPWNAEQSVAIVMGGEFHFCPSYLPEHSNDGPASPGQAA